MKTDAFFVTSDKRDIDADYNDYAIDRRLFHWQSQNSTSANSATGRRYLGKSGDSHVLLLVRQAKSGPLGRAVPYTCLGPASYVTHTGNNPITLYWRLRHPLTPRLYDALALRS